MSWSITITSAPSGEPGCLSRCDLRIERPDGGNYSFLSCGLLVALQEAAMEIDPQVALELGVAPTRVVERLTERVS